MKTIYLVMCDSGGAHESGDVMSVWDTRAGADEEVSRLTNLRATEPGKLTTTNGGRFGVVELTLNTPSDAYLDI